MLLYVSCVLHNTSNVVYFISLPSPQNSILEVLTQVASLLATGYEGEKVKEASALLTALTAKTEAL